MKSTLKRESKDRETVQSISPWRLEGSRINPLDSEGIKPDFILSATFGTLSNKYRRFSGACRARVCVCVCPLPSRWWCRPHTYSFTCFRENAFEVYGLLRYMPTTVRCEVTHRLKQSIVCSWNVRIQRVVRVIYVSPRVFFTDLGPGGETSISWYDPLATTDSDRVRCLPRTFSCAEKVVVRRRGCL